MTPETLECFFAVVERARKGNENAKALLLFRLETERKPTILRKLRCCDVKSEDCLDALHDIEIKVYENIEQLRATEAYFAWEARIIREISRSVRDSYRVSGDPLDSVIKEVENAYKSEEVFYEYIAACR